MRVGSNRSFTEGALFTKIFAFALPIMATNILQLLYSSADNIVAGRFSGDPEALAAVGCTTAFTYLIINLLVGLSSGAGIIVAQQFGAKNRAGVSRIVHTAMLTSIVGGLAFMGVGLLLHKPVLSLIVANEALLGKANLYVFIICFGIPASSVYNFGAAILRSTGDSRTPLAILTVTGLINVLLNLLFVIAFHLSIVGVALATVISQYLSAAAVVVLLLRAEGEAHQLKLCELGIDAQMLKRMLILGIPAGLQSAAYNVANMVVLGGVNTFTRPTVSANAVAGTIDGIVYNCLSCFTHASMTFTGQNFGAGKPERTKRSLVYSLVQVVTVVTTVSAIVYLACEPMVKLFVQPDDPLFDEVVDAGVRWIRFLIFFYVLCGISEVISGFLRGLGYSGLPMIMSLAGICLTRILWVSVAFPLLPHEIESLLLCYPISWTVTSLLMCTLLPLATKRIRAAGGGGTASEGEDAASAAET